MKGLLFVFIQGVTLPHGPQANAAAQMIQGLQMILPAGINLLQNQKLFRQTRLFIAPCVTQGADFFIGGAL